MINNITGQMYIGQTKNFDRRMDQHFRGDNADKQDIDEACLEYGREAFTVKILEVFDEYDKDVLDDSDVVKNITMAWLTEKSFISTTLKTKIFGD